MGERTEQVARHLEQQRGELRDNLIDLKQKAHRAVEWRALCEDRPMTMLGVAFAGGVLASALVGARPRAASRAPLAAARAGTPSAIAGTWSRVTGALLALATARAAVAVEQLLPGFQAEYTKAERRERS